MKSILSLAIAFVLSVPAISQKKAVTENGEEVILYTDGTWKYVNDSVQEEKEIPVNPKAFTKSSSSTFLLKSNKFNVGVWIDPKKWSFKKAENNDDAEYEFELKGKDLYGMMINELVEIPLESLKKIAIDNAREAAPDIQLIKEEYRTVNGQKVLMLQLNGSAEGIKFSYYGYYYSNENGTMQMVLYTSQNLLKNYLEEIESHLNGFVVLDKN
jgi:hypothetical protein